MGYAALAVFALLCGPALAIDERLEVFLSGDVRTPDVPLLSVGDRVRAAGRPDIDYALFTYELIAYVAREVFDDHGDSALGGRRPGLWHPGSPKVRSRFGAHCLSILARIGEEVLASGVVSPFRASPAVITAYSLATRTAIFALRHSWKPLRPEHDERPPLLSLEPKVGTRKIGAALTYRW